MFRVLVCLAAITQVIAGAAPVSAADPAPGCADARARQFDFWIGQWRVTENGKLAGHNHIERVLGGCALIENWSGAKGGSGKSLNFFDRDDGLWHQTWIDGSGGALFLAGKFEDGAMRMEGERPGADGQPPVRHRITWTPLADGSVRQLWESTPAGKLEWSRQFDGLYVRAKDVPSAGNTPEARPALRICAPTRVSSRGGPELRSATNAKGIPRGRLLRAGEDRGRRLPFPTEGCATA
jgi:hypothetical protein